MYSGDEETQREAIDKHFVLVSSLLGLETRKPFATGLKGVSIYSGVKGERGREERRYI